MAEMPEGHQGEGFFATSLSNVIGLGKKKFYLASAFCNFLLWYRIYGNHGLAL